MKDNIIRIPLFITFTGIVALASVHDYDRGRAPERVEDRSSVLLQVSLHELEQRCDHVVRLVVLGTHDVDVTEAFGHAYLEAAVGRRFVREQLATARTSVVSTRKYDIHRRYVADPFYAFNDRGIEPTFLKGRHLNQELVNKGFAKVV